MTEQTNPTVTIRTTHRHVIDADGDRLEVQTPRPSDPEGTVCALVAKGYPRIPLTAAGWWDLRGQVDDILAELPAPAEDPQDHLWTAQEVLPGRWAAVPPKADPDAAPPFPMVAMHLDGVRCYPFPDPEFARTAATLANGVGE